MKQYPIILADDDEDDILFFQECFLEACPQKQLLVVKNGKELMDILGTGVQPASIFVDLNMPLMNGHECLVEIRSQAIFNSTKLMVLSTSNNEKDRKTCLAGGANNYFVKPNCMAQLRSIIKEVCSC